MANVMLKQKVLLAGLLGLVSASFSVLTQPSLAASIRPAVVEAATKEWKDFGMRTTKNGKLVKDGKKEGDEGYWQRISYYWENSNTGNSGKSQKEVISDDNPWSAVFVSFVMKRAGAGNQFKYSVAHRDYIRDAIANKKDGKRTAPFVGYELNEYAPGVGDLVCASREDEGKLTYCNALTYKSKLRGLIPGKFLAHCDIVVARRIGEVDVIGGNVGNSVTKDTIPLVNGRVPSIRVEKEGVKRQERFVLIRNQATKK